MASDRRAAGQAGDAGRFVAESGWLTDMSDIDVWLILTRLGGEVLLTLGNDAGPAARRWYLPGGRPDAGERAIPAMVRYARESADLTVTEADLQLATVVYWHDIQRVSRIGLFFAAEHDPPIMGEPRISWPPERSTLKWSSQGTLRPGTDPVCAAGVGLARQGISCAVLGSDGQITCETRASPQPYARHSISTV
jgi:8-oxo-dGTP pyrophosphatase MutT (NUDIX family)